MLYLGNNNRVLFIFLLILLGFGSDALEWPPFCSLSIPGLIKHSYIAHLLSFNISFITITTDRPPALAEKSRLFRLEKVLITLGEVKM